MPGFGSLPPETVHVPGNIAKPHAQFLCMGRNISAVPPCFRHPFLRMYGSHSRVTSVHVRSYQPIPFHGTEKAFTPAAPVGNSRSHLNIRKLPADDFLSLQVDKTLLCTINAFFQLPPILTVGVEKVKTLPENQSLLTGKTAASIQANFCNFSL